MQTFWGFCQQHRVSISSGVVGATSGGLLGFAVDFDFNYMAGFAIVAGLMWFVYFTPQEALAHIALRRYEVLPMITGFVAFGFFYSPTPMDQRDIPGSFFEVTSQIIPVLILVTIVDVRRNIRLHKDRILPTLVVLTTGEFTALAGIVFPSGANLAFVFAVLVAGFCALFLSILSDYTPHPRAEKATPVPRSTDLGWPD